MAGVAGDSSRLRLVFSHHTADEAKKRSIVAFIGVSKVVILFFESC
jgi:hypothetical protein